MELASHRLPAEVLIVKMKAVIKCRCGQRILTKDVLQTGYLLQSPQTSYVYVKYRCPRCKRPGEEFVPHQNWHSGMLLEKFTETGVRESKRFEGMGKITLDEQVGFHKHLKKLTALNSEQLLSEETEKI